jgi:membrane protein required for beta-lactamase induction
MMYQPYIRSQDVKSCLPFEQIVKWVTRCYGIAYQLLGHLIHVLTHWIDLIVIRPC